MWGTCLQTVSFVWRLSVSWSPEESPSAAESFLLFGDEQDEHCDRTTNELKLTANSADASLSRPSYTRSFHIIQSALFNADLLCFSSSRFEGHKEEQVTGCERVKSLMLPSRSLVADTAELAVITSLLEILRFKVVIVVVIVVILI